ncbi:hypothetical protein [Flavobacterium sp.]|uniref:hypothetical protein n=1 Tax=Flavobacterium sp. TaxID=239 RepID=UPI002616FF3F|nr:hypothetical protein [Flavobacterium sp.]
MKYKEKLLDLILNHDDDALMEWIGIHPELEQVDIFREMTALVEQMAAENGEDVHDTIPNFDTIPHLIDDYEDKILDEKLAEVQYNMAVEAEEKAFEKLEEAYEGIRESVIQGVLENPGNEDMLEVARKIVAIEKDAGAYEPENWIRIGL